MAVGTIDDLYSPYDIREYVPGSQKTDQNYYGTYEDSRYPDEEVLFGSINTIVRSLVLDADGTLKYKIESHGFATPLSPLPYPP